MKVNIEFDTVSKEMVVSMDGTIVKDVKNVYAYTYGEGKDGKDEFHIEVSRREKNNDEDFTTTTKP